LGCVNPGFLYKSLHAVPACQAVDARLGARHRRRTPIICSRQQALDHLAVEVGEAEIAALEAVGQLGVVEAQEVHERRVQVVDVNLVLDHTEAQVVALTLGDSGLDAAAGHPLAPARGRCFPELEDARQEVNWE